MRQRSFGICLLAGIVSVILIGRLTEAAEKVQYKLNLETGEKYYVRLLLKHKISRSLRDQKQDMEAIIGLGYKFDVNEIKENGDTWIDHTFDWVKVIEKGNIGGANSTTYEYDSSKRGSETGHTRPIHAAYLGESFSVKLTPQAQVKDVKGLKAMLESMSKKIGQEFVDHKLQFNKEFIKEYLARPMAVYPAKSFESGMFPKIAEKYVVVESKWTLKDRHEGIAVIDNNSIVKFTPQAKREMEETGKVRCDISGKETGVVKIQEATGQIIHSEITRDIVVRTEMEAGGSWFEGWVIKNQTAVIFEMSERKK